ncbi:MAG: 23S rRNA (adenine(2030)-N(6))-methyltransferase RlmJ [Nitratireductor sp.]|nr:23S rRNA (adenine(2030)-N(6))-methyltransferase RlmJ [Nitratireductor sp.]
MNYRHDYHAGNFADVFKHIVLARVIAYLKNKDKAFRVSDIHGGAGRYRLPPASDRDHRGNPPEWVSGIGRLAGWTPGAETLALIRPYLDCVFGEGVAATETPGTYPGSPLIAMTLMRGQDRLSAYELHPEAAARLKALFAGNHRARIIELDGWLAPGAHLPPKEKRGLLLADPPFEEAADFDRMVAALVTTTRRWQGGVQAYWYPLKHAERVRRFKRALAETEISDLIAIELEIDRAAQPPKLHGCGMILRRAPYSLEAEMRQLLPELTPRLASAPGRGAWRIERLSTE